MKTIKFSVVFGLLVFSVSAQNDGQTYGALQSSDRQVVDTSKFIEDKTQKLNRKTAFLKSCYVYDTLIVDTCAKNYTSPSGNYLWTISGVYQDTMVNAGDCDRVITVQLVISPPVSVMVDQIDHYLTSIGNSPNAFYQWIDCSDNSPISGANSHNYEATSFGEYAVVVSNGVCTDTSECYEVKGSANLKELVSSFVKVYPNPTENILNIDVIKYLDVEALKIVNLQGQTMKHFNGLVNQVDISDLSAGTYFLVISSEGKSIHKKITKQ